MNKIVQYVLERNQSQSAQFVSPDVTARRRQHRAKHPTEIAALKCMDGRVNLSVFTDVPVGIIQPHRTIGGKFDLGMPYLGDLIRDWVEYSISKGRDCLLLVTYHFSKSNQHWGCAGFKYDTQAAIHYTHGLRKQAERVYGEQHWVVHPVQIGVETDEGALIVHGDAGGTLNMAEHTETDPAELAGLVRALFPEMKQQIFVDFVNLLVGNQRHIRCWRKEDRAPLDLQHCERILALGRGFDWLHEPNQALIIGPYEQNLSAPIAVAARILLDNLESGRIAREDGVLLLTSGVYMEETGHVVTGAWEKTLYLARVALQAIHEQVPELVPHLHVLPGVTSHSTRRFTQVDPAKLGVLLPKHGELVTA